MPSPTLPATELPPGITYVQTDAELRRLFRDLKGHDLIALDTEAASFHRFEDRVYLIQLSTRTTTAVIDPLSVEDLSPIGKTLANPKIEVVFHDADYDLRLLDRDLGFQAHSVFDTRLAAQLLHEPGVGLAALLAKYFDVTLDKRFQRADWSARPLSAAMLSYAARDTQYLPALRDILRDKLAAAGRLRWAEEEFALLEGVRWTAREPDDQAFLRIKGARLLPPRSLGVLREVHRWREGTAKRRDRASFRILNNQALVEIAKASPGDLQALQRIAGVGPETVRRNGKAILAAVARGQKLKESDLPKPRRTKRPKADPQFSKRLEGLKGARNVVAKRLGLDPGVACPNGTLEAVAAAAPHSIAELERVPSIRRWQVQEFGEGFLEAVAAAE